MFTVLIFIIILGLLVFVHELGHFLVAKKNGVKVEEFGFGEVIVKIKDGNIYKIIPSLEIVIPKILDKNSEA